MTFGFLFLERDQITEVVIDVATTAIKNARYI
jgi:hypothetical protein